MSLCLAALLLLPSCALWTWEPHDKYSVRYYDRNGDGKVDLEIHHLPGAQDADWQLQDDNFDGRFERKVRFGAGVREELVDLPTPTNVKISCGPLQ